MSLTAKEVREIRSILERCDMEDLRLVHRLMKTRQDSIGRMSIATLRRGAKVKFKPRKRGGYVTGVVEKVNQKTVTIGKCSDGKIWRVPGTMLEEDQ